MKCENCGKPLSRNWGMKLCSKCLVIKMETTKPNPIEEIKQLIDNLTIEDLINEGKEFYTEEDIANMDTPLVKFVIKLEHVLQRDDELIKRLSEGANYNMTTKPNPIDTFKEWFEANYLDGDEVQEGQMIASTEIMALIPTYIEAELQKARIDTAKHLHRNQGLDLPRRDFDTDTDEYICDEYIPSLEAKLKVLQGE